MGKYVFGIDLGTTYSCISYVDETGRAVVVNNSEGTNTTPSVVNFTGDNQVVVGEVAKETSIIDPLNTCSLVKTLIGKSDFAINYNGEDKSPEEVSAYILRKVTQDASKILDTEVKDVVITCPAYFGTAERTATKSAGQIAGLNVLEIISEPTAAALYYGCTKEQNSKNILVFDLGGGTFDVTIMSISAEKIEVICSDGNHQLGGKDWDEAVMRYLVSEFTNRTDFQGEIDEYAQQDLRIKTEKAKQQLSSREEVPVMLDIDGKRERIDLSRNTFDEITSSYLDEAIDKTDAAIALAKEKGYEVDEILLVGGSTRMPQVTKKLVEKYGKEPKILEPDEAVAKGAAIHAVNVYIDKQKSIQQWEAEGKQEDKINKDIQKEDFKEELVVSADMMQIGGKRQTVVVATTKSFAIEVMVDDDKEMCDNLIIKNQPMTDGVISVSREYGTYYDKQEEVEITIYESDFMEETFEVDETYELGAVILELPLNLKKGSPIECTLTLNTEGILDVYAKDLTSNRDVRATLQAKGIMSEEKVNELKAKSKKMMVR